MGIKKWGTTKNNRQLLPKMHGTNTSHNNLMSTTTHLRFIKTLQSHVEQCSAIINPSACGTDNTIHVQITKNTL